MKKFLTWMVVFAVAVGGGILVYWPVPNWRLYDANWQPLAMTQAESYCAGYHVALSGYSRANNADADQCVTTSSMDNVTPNVGMSVRWGCQGVYAGDPSFPVNDCVNAVEGNGIWFLQHGGYTFEWNDGNKRPSTVQNNISQAPRGERSQSGRVEDGRMVP